MKNEYHDKKRSSGPDTGNRQPDMNIRKYDKNDYCAILDIYAASKLDELRHEDATFELLSLERDTKRLSQLLESEIYIYEADGVIGYCAHYGSEIRALFVHPKSRGKGIGKCLLEFLLAKIPGSAKLYVAKSNTPAKTLYTEFGFEVVEEFATAYNGTPVFANTMIRFAKNHKKCGRYGCAYCETSEGNNNMDNEKRDFDSVAASWDENPNRVKLAKDVAAAIKDQVKITSAMNIADFGCGTGLLSLELQPMVHSLTGIDGSQGMLDVLQDKVDRLQLANVHTQLVDLDKDETLTGRYDLIVSNMTLHHIKNVAPLLTQLHNVLTPGGTLCITDLDLDGGLFHEDNTGIFHFGFDRQDLRKAFSKAGFTDILDTTATEIVKPDKNGEIRKFPVFLMTGRRK